jgi:predicted transposase YbfD/YdcC
MLEGSIVTAAAMQCQQEAARYTTQELGADYLFGLIGNQEGIRVRATLKLPQAFLPPEYDSGWRKEHG